VDHSSFAFQVLSVCWRGNDMRLPHGQTNYQAKDGLTRAAFRTKFLGRATADLRGYRLQPRCPGPTTLRPRPLSDDQKAELAAL